MIKKVLISIAALLLVAGVTYASLRHYDNYKQYKSNADKIAAEKTAEAIKLERAAVKARQDSLASEYNREHAECLKGENAYASLPATTQAKLIKPVCGSEILN